jgi:hypothetical protein
MRGCVRTPPADRDRRGEKHNDRDGAADDIYGGPDPLTLRTKHNHTMPTWLMT